MLAAYIGGTSSEKLDQLLELVPVPVLVPILVVVQFRIVHTTHYKLEVLEIHSLAFYDDDEEEDFDNEFDLPSQKNTSSKKMSAQKNPSSKKNH